MAQPTVSVIIVNWNTRDLLLQCLKSLYKNSNNIEVIVVDNASDDDSAEAVSQAFPDTIVIRNSRSLCG
ncbi:MAG: glycosyltransferase [Firmicutes bacterium]|nr:glycosyltransferase [Bacillota bacterium]